MSPPRKSKPREVLVRRETYEQLASYARRQNCQIGTALDAILTKFLDEKAGKA